MSRNFGQREVVMFKGCSIALTMMGVSPNDSREIAFVIRYLEYPLQLRTLYSHKVDLMDLAD